MSYNNDFKKQEFIHLHGLLHKVAEYVDEEAAYGDIEDVEGYQEYLEREVKPTSIHKDKTDHKESVFLLARSINDFLEGGGQSIRQ